jgi:hypothetical protein
MNKIVVLLLIVLFLGCAGSDRCYKDVREKLQGSGLPEMLIEETASGICE